MSIVRQPPSMQQQQQIYDGYATIRTRGLYRTRSRTAADLEKSQNRGERKRTLSLKSDFSNSSNCSSNNNNNDVGYISSYHHHHHPMARPVKTPTIGTVETEPLYTTPNPLSLPCTSFRPMSESSSSGGGGGGCRESGSIASGCSSGTANDYQNVKKNSRFSLDSLQSSATPKTPDYAAATDDDNIFLYTAPDSPHRDSICSSSIRCFDISDRHYSPPPKTSFEMQDLSSSIIRSTPTSETSSSSPRRPPIRTTSRLQYKRAQSLVDSGRAARKTATNSFHRSDSESPTATSCPPLSPLHLQQPPATLEFKPKIQPSYVPLQQQHNSNPKINCYQLPLLSTNRSSSAEILEYHRHSSVTTADDDGGAIVMTDADEILVVPSAMPVLMAPGERRYHTLGHMRVQSHGSYLTTSGASPMGSRIMMMSESFHGHQNGIPSNGYSTATNKSAGNIYASTKAALDDLERLAPEYIDPLDFKIGCQTTLRSKPIIPWYELAIRKDFKRQSCPPITGCLTSGSTTIVNGRNSGNQAHVVAAFEQSLSNMTSRLQQLTATAERKDGELTDMRQTIELLRKQSIQAGLTTAHMQSMGGGQNQNDLLGGKPSPPLPPSSGLNMMSRVQQQQQQHQTNHHQQQHHHHHHTINGNANANDTMQRHHSSDSMCSLNSISSGCSAHDKKKKKGWLRSSFTKAFSRNAKISKTNRHAAGGGNSSANVSSSASGHNGTSNSNSDPHNSTLGSIGSSSGGNQHHHNGLLHIGEGCGSGSGGSGGLASLATQPAPSQTSPTKSSPAKTVTLIENAKPIDAIDHEDHHIVEDLKKQLREKDLVLTDIRLEALSSASQLENLKDTVMKMRAEMISLKQNNERLQKLVTSRSLAGSEASLGNAISPNGSIGESRRYSLADGNSRPPMELPKRLEEEVEEENIPPAPAPEPPPPPLSPTTHIDLTPPPPAIEPHSMPSPTHMATAVEEIPDITDGKKLAIACYLGQPESFPKYCEEILETDEFYRSTTNGIASGPDGKESNSFDERKQFPTATLNEFVIAYTYISGKTTWQNLDYIVRKTFKDYVSRIDPGTNLGLNTDSITSYHLGEAKRGPEMGFPELLPCGYIIGNVRTLYICLQGVGSLAFDSLIPRSIVHRYISLLTEHRRLILCGPSGTGKSYLSRRLAEFLVARSGRGNPSEAIATFNVDHKSSKELRQYLGHVAEQAAIANGASELPSVIILDNLHHASALGDVFSCLLSAGPAAKLPCIIGTMSQATCNTTNLQLHHNFRWVLTANHMEPVKGFLGRFLRRRLFQLELQTQNHQPELSTVLAWLPTVWQHINRFLEIHSSSDVTIGPRLFLSCPLDLKDSQVWFTDIWNYHLSPYLIEAVREGVQLYGRRGGAWNDPSVFIRNSYPWPYGPDSVPPLRQINAEDVGLEGITTTNTDAQDPLLNMLMRLQEAANYSENQDQESDCASLDSNITPDSSAGAE